MTMITLHGDSADLEGEKHRGADTAMQAVQPDARFLRTILFALIACTLAVGAAAGMAAFNAGQDVTVVAADN